MKKILLTLLSAFLICSCAPAKKKKAIYPAVSLSVSSDGRYVVSAHHGKQLVLWDLQNHSSRVISDDANIYSAYFIKGTDKIIWQDVKANVVHVQTATGEEIKSFNPGFASYGHVLSPDLSTYIGSDIDWNLYLLRGKQKKHIKRGFDSDGYLSNGKLLDLTLVNHILLSAGSGASEVDKKPIPNHPHAGRQYGGFSGAPYSYFGGVVSWDITKGLPQHKFPGNAVKTNATLSPDGKYVVAGDENTRGFVWDTDTGKRLFELDSLSYGKDLGVCEDGVHCRWDNTGLIKPPKDFCFKVEDDHCLFQSYIFAMKFISPTQYLRFTTHVYYAILYDVLDPQPKKYFKLEGFPDVNGYTEAARTDTAPEAGILVMGAAAKSGIRVYKYDKENETLQLVWAPDDFERTSPPDNPKT